MTNYRETTNETTGETEFLFNAKLVSIGEKTLQNSNGKNFKIVSLSFDTPSGDPVTRTAMCFESNYNYGIEVGTSYLSNLSFDAEGNPQLRMSHLSNSDRATASDFAGLVGAKASAPTEEYSSDPAL